MELMKKIMEKSGILLFIIYVLTSFSNFEYWSRPCLPITRSSSQHDWALVSFLLGCGFQLSSINGLDAVFRASSDCDRLGCLCSMWLYSLISPTCPVLFIQIISGWRLVLLNFCHCHYQWKGAIKERTRPTWHSWFCRDCWDSPFNNWDCTWFTLAGLRRTFVAASIFYLALYLLFVPYGSKTEAVEEKHMDVRRWRGDNGGLRSKQRSWQYRCWPMSWSPFSSKWWEQVGHGTANCWGILAANNLFGMLQVWPSRPWPIYFVIVCVVSGSSFGVTQMLIRVSTNLWMLALMYCFWLHLQFLSSLTTVTMSYLIDASRVLKVRQRPLRFGM